MIKNSLESFLPAVFYKDLNFVTGFLREVSKVTVQGLAGLEKTDGVD